MIKAVSISLCVLMLCAARSGAQTSPTDTAISEAVLRQANKIVLQQTLVEAKRSASRGDLSDAAKKYQECYDLTLQIGPGVKTETAQAIAGLTSARLALARADQSRNDFHSADVEVGQVLKADPHNAAALAFKKDNDHRTLLMAGKVADASTQEQIPVVAKAKENSRTMVQDGKLFYEMGKLDEADAKLNEALKLDPDNQAAFYYLNLVKQARYSRESLQHTADTQFRMNQVEKTWVQPKPTANIPDFSNPYATNSEVHTGPGRTAIMEKLDRIHLDNVSYDGLPLSEVLRDLSAKAASRDPEKRGINFLINPNADNPDHLPAPANAGGGVGGGLGGAPGGGGGFEGGAAPAGPLGADQTTGFSAANTPAPAEQIDIGADVVIKLNLSDVRLADVIEAIVLVANKPIKYSVRDYAIVFQAQDTRFAQPTYVVRTFKVDPNTFYSGLESVTAQNFGSPGSSGGSSGGGGGSSGGGGGGGGNNNSSGGVVGVVDAVPGASSARSSGGSSGGGGGGRGGGGGGGGGSTGGGSTGANPLDRGGQPPTSAGAGGGLKYITRLDLTADVSMAARNFFNTLGLNLAYPKSVFFNDRLGLLVVRATEQDLDTIEQALQALNRVAPQVHIKARFIEVQQTDSKALGFDWYLGNFVNGSVIASGGSSGSLNTGSTSAANPLGTFPGSSTASQIAPSSTDQSLTSGLRNSLSAPTLATVTGIMTDPNFRVAIQALQQRSGVETLAEPEVVTTSGRQTQMKATQLRTVITDYNFQGGTSGTTTGGGGGNIP